MFKFLLDLFKTKQQPMSFKAPHMGFMAKNRFAASNYVTPNGVSYVDSVDSDCFVDSLNNENLKSGLNLDLDLRYLKPDNNDFN